MRPEDNKICQNHHLVSHKQWLDTFCYS